MTSIVTISHNRHQNGGESDRPSIGKSIQFQLNTFAKIIKMLSKDCVTLFNQIGKPIIVATYPRSGTHLTIDLLRKQFQECESWKFLGESKSNLYLDIDPLLPSLQQSKVEQKLALGLLS